MRKVNWASVTASADGDFEKLPAGPYVAVITDATDNENKQYVEIVYDIAEGEHKGYYSDDWGKSHPYAHHIFMSYKDTALGMLKGRLEAIQASNPGFDAFAAWDAGRLDMFRNRIVGINLQEEEYERNDGDTGVRLNVVQVVDAQRVRDGLVKTRERKTIDAKKAHVPTTQAEKDAFNDVDIPF
ncbi:hypothetical protein ACTQ1D_03885 [Parafannyhessea umbonata]|uniref:hypothetical protein n=1 Tax=Parafannyhessea umbonata TaxID=604330 RepID=UPI003F9C3667